MNIRLSIVVPLYNESARIGDGLSAILDFINSREYPCEVVLVDDGSADDTVKIAEQTVGNDDRFRLFSYKPNQGKGEAVKRGMLEARGNVRLFTDIDMSVPIDCADVFLAKVESGTDVVIGTRRAEKSNVIVHQPKIREVLGEGYRRFVRALFAPNITDFTCGFKAFNAKATQAVFSQSRIKRWSFDTEILFLAWRWGFSISEIPVSWTNSPATKVNLLYDVARSGYELFQIRWNWFVGRYNKS